MVQFRPGPSHQTRQTQAGDMQMCGAEDTSGDALGVTREDIEDIAFDRGLPVAERIFRLGLIVDELEEQSSDKVSSDRNALLDAARGHIATLRVQPQFGEHSSPFASTGAWDADADDADED